MGLQGVDDGIFCWQSKFFTEGDTPGPTKMVSPKHIQMELQHLSQALATHTFFYPSR